MVTYNVITEVTFFYILFITILLIYCLNVRLYSTTDSKDMNYILRELE